jgi:hypothetical protein
LNLNLNLNVFRRRLIHRLRGSTELAEVRCSQIIKKGPLGYSLETMKPCNPAKKRDEDALQTRARRGPAKSKVKGLLLKSLNIKF